jgi:hypothetical protein
MGPIIKDGALTSNSFPSKRRLPTNLGSLSQRNENKQTNERMIRSSALLISNTLKAHEPLVALEAWSQSPPYVTKKEGAQLGKSRSKDAFQLLT